jgi:hypothetical protein
MIIAERQTIKKQSPLRMTVQAVDSKEIKLS